jgi:hypothetical protein
MGSSREPRRVRERGQLMQATKYKDLVVLLILLDEVELRSRELAERYPELRVMAEAVSDVTDLCDLATTLEETDS